jgi:orotate phosphoribosyltransferase
VSDRDELLTLIKDLAVVHGRVTLSSGREADYYIDLRRITLHRTAAPLVGRVLRELTSDWDYEAVGGLTLGADPVAAAVMHASQGAVDAFVVRKAEKQHGMQQRIEGPSVEGRRVLIVEDVSTTGSSPLTAARAAQEAGATVVGVALIVDRGGVAAIEEAGFTCRAAYTLADLGLS